MSRSASITPQVQDKIVKSLRAGNYRTTSAKVAGVSVSTFYLWLDKGKKGKRGPYIEFMQAVEKAEAEGQAALVATVNVASKDSWQAAAWILERKYPEEWGRKDALALSGKIAHEGDIKHDVTETIDLTPEVQRLAARLTAAYFRTLRGGKKQSPGSGASGGSDVDTGKPPRGVK